MLVILPTVLLLFTVLWILCLLQWLHGVLLAVYGLWLFGIAAVACVVYWIVQLQCGKLSAQQQDKQWVAWRLILLLLFAFSMTFIMIVLYRWMNTDGHVHGASSTSGEQLVGSGAIGPDGQVEVFLGVHQHGYQLPIVVQLISPQMMLFAGRTATIALSLENKSNEVVRLRLFARVTPGVIKKQVHYNLLYTDQTLVLAPNVQQTLKFPVIIDADFPSVYQPFTLTHFVFGVDDAQAWQKMQGPIQLIKS